VLQAVVRNGDTLVRLGGDEFGILMENCSLNKAQNIANELH
jgi:GGDEF domain-containing protein